MIEICPKCNNSHRVERYNGNRPGNRKCQSCRTVFYSTNVDMEEPSPENRSCYHCQNIMIRNAIPGYSEWTPPEGFQLACRLNHWWYDVYSDGHRELAYCLEQARTCPDFQLTKYLKEMRD